MMITAKLQPCQNTNFNLDPVTDVVEVVTAAVATAAAATAAVVFVLLLRDKTRHLILYLRICHVTKCIRNVLGQHRVIVSIG